MIRRFLWFLAGFITGVIAVSKARAYIRVHTSESVGTFVLGSSEDDQKVGVKTASLLFRTLKKNMKERQEELTEKYITRPDEQLTSNNSSF